MQTINTWIKQLSRARDLPTAKLLISSAIKDISTADSIVVIAEGDEHLESLLNTIQLLSEQYAPDEHFWLARSEIPLLCRELLNTSQNSLILVIPVKDEKTLAVILVGWFTLPTEHDKYLPPLLILAECFLIVLQNVVIHTQLAKQMAERTSNLSEAKHAAEAANLLKSSFLSAASHDLRQPLQQISSLIEVLIRQSSEQLPQTQLRRVQRIISDMNILMNSLLNLDKLETGRIQPHFKKIQIMEVFTTLKSDFALQAAEKQLNLCFESSDKSVISDRALLLQILRNLIGNAIKYTQVGEIKITTTQHADFLMLCVHDTGPGVEQARQASIFDPFFQLPSQRSDNSGFGIGLALVKALAETMNHPITLVSEVGKGSVFSIQLPTNNLAIDELSKQDEAILQFPEQAKCVVLYLEDDDDLAESISTLLSMEGYQVITASSSGEAIQAIDKAQKTPDIIVTDNSLDAGENGIEVVQKLRIQMETYIPAIMLTGYTESAVHQKALRVVQKVLSKPVDADDLLKEIDTIYQQQIQTTLKKSNPKFESQLT
jgi:signal transduction histidine kinase/CheY-like chemotaxis protein